MDNESVDKTSTTTADEETTLAPKGTDSIEVHTESVQSWDDLEVFKDVDSPQKTTPELEEDTTLSTIQLFEDPAENTDNQPTETSENIVVTTVKADLINEKNKDSDMTTNGDFIFEITTESLVEDFSVSDMTTEKDSKSDITTEDESITDMTTEDTVEEVFVSDDLGRLTTIAPGAGDDTSAQPNIPDDQSTVAPQDKTQKPAYYPINDSTETEEILDDDVDYDGNYDDANILDVTTTGAPVVDDFEDVTLSSEPLFESEAVVAEDEYGDGDDLDSGVTDKIFEETTTGSSSVEQPLSNEVFISEPVVAEEEYDEEVKIEFDQTTTGSPLNSQEELGFEIEAVVAEEEDGDINEIVEGLQPPLDISAVFAEQDNEKEFYETTTGSVLKQINSQDSVIFGNYDSNLFEDTDDKENEIEDTNNDENIYFDDTDDVDALIAEANDADNYIDEGFEEENNENVTVGSQENTTNASDDTNETTLKFPEEVIPFLLNLSDNELVTTVRVVVSPEITESTSRKVVSVVDFLNMYQTTTIDATERDTTEAITDRAINAIIQNTLKPANVLQVRIFFFK